MENTKLVRIVQGDWPCGHAPETDGLKISVDILLTQVGRIISTRLICKKISEAVFPRNFIEPKARPGARRGSIENTMKNTPAHKLELNGTTPEVSEKTK